MFTSSSLVYFHFEVCAITTNVGKGKTGHATMKTNMNKNKHVPNLMDFGLKLALLSPRF